MSFFIRKGDGSKNYTDRATKKRRAPDAGKKVKAKKKVENEEIHSDGSDVEGRGDAGYESEEDHETAEEKRLRLAKVYLAEVEKELAERKGGTEDLSKDIEERLREDVDEERGKLRKEFASKLTSLSWADVTYLGNKNHKLSLTCVIISPDSKRVYSGSKDASLLVWDLEKKIQGPNVLFKIPGGRKGEHAKHPGHCNTILALAVSSDNKLLASGDMDKLIHIWDTATMTRIHTFRGHRDAVSGLVFRRGTHTLYSASHDRSVKIWSVDERSYVETLYGHQDKITGIDCGARERCVTVGGRDASARVWKIVEESQLVFNGPQSSIDCVAMLNEDHWVTGGEDGHLAVWGSHKKKPLTLVQRSHGTDPSNDDPNWISALTTLRNTDTVITGSRDGKIRVWQVGPGFRSIKEVHSVEVKGFVNSLSISGCGGWIVAGVGQEHRLGRWWRDKEAKNKLVIIKVPNNDQDDKSSDSDDGADGGAS